MEVIPGQRLPGARPSRPAIRVATMVLCAYTALRGSAESPFPVGRSMGNLGTILWENASSSRQPWIPASCLDDSLRMGFGIAAVYYYDLMDNLRDRSLRTLAAGGWWQATDGLVSVKGAFSRFDALGLYSEDKGFLSVGTRIVPLVRMSAELEGVRSAVALEDTRPASVLTTGASLWIPSRFLGSSVRVRGIPLVGESATGHLPPLTCTLGLHTGHHQYGAQGLVVHIVEPGEHFRLRFVLGEAYRVHERFRLDFAVGTNPLLVAFAVNVEITSLAANGSLVHHDLLGWSKGFSLQWAR